MNNDLLDQLTRFVDLGAHTNRSQAAIALLYLHSYLTTDNIASQGYDFSVRANLPVLVGRLYRAGVSRLHSRMSPALGERAAHLQLIATIVTYRRDS